VLVHPSWGDALAGALPHFEIETIEGADHAPHQTTPGRYIDLIKRFVNGSMR
jgi:pimeloyl-ACP methyl ester carboxylesterase